MLRRGGAVKQVVKATQHVRGLVDQVEIGFAVNPPEEGIGQVENIDVFEDGGRIKMPECQLHGLSSPQMTGSHRSVENKNAPGHGTCLVFFFLSGVRHSL
jgi:hypothetical protein